MGKIKGWKRNLKSNHEYRWDNGTSTVTLSKVTSQGRWIWLAQQSYSVGGFRDLGIDKNFQTVRSKAMQYMKSHPRG